MALACLYVRCGCGMSVAGLTVLLVCVQASTCGKPSSLAEHRSLRPAGQPGGGGMYVFDDVRLAASFCIEGGKVRFWKLSIQVDDAVAVAFGWESCGL